MKTIAISVLLAATAFAGGKAFAQETGYVMPPVPYIPSESQRSDPGSNADAWRQTGADFGYGGGTDFAVQRVEKALKAGDFAKAERVLAFFVRRNPRSADGHFYLGTVRMDLGKWDEAKASLVKAQRRDPAHPDPTSRLGVTYAKLGNLEAAYAQRARLTKLAANCRDACELAPKITSGIAMIDAAIAETPR